MNPSLREYFLAQGKMEWRQVFNQHVTLVLFQGTEQEERNQDKCTRQGN